MPAEPLIPRDRWSVFATGLDHPECLAFDHTGHLYAGGEAGQIYRISPDGKTVTEITSLGSFVGGIAFDPTDTFLLACCPARGIVKVFKDGTHQPFATHAGDHPLHSPNYGLFTRDGTYYVTDSGQWNTSTGRLLRFTPDGHGTTLATHINYANGLALTQDEQTLYLVESATNSILRLPLPTPHGGAERSAAPRTNLKLFASPIGRLPDGLSLDTQGNLYCSCYASDDIHQISPTGQTKLFAHDPWAILLSRPTNTAFGVSDPTTMYAANLGRTTITRADVGVQGQPLANLR
jgi:gluconolactonase